VPLAEALATRGRQARDDGQEGLFRILNIGYLDLFGACNFGFGAFILYFLKILQLNLRFPRSGDKNSSKQQQHLLH